ncbi:MAG: hypothetical protein M0R80_28360 [Proteobacteria bacterium]|jgi:hypothetical protein|nr:hypothetical protein [Pseudomonadota bacterium]
MTRIYLSPPHVFGNERALVTDVLTPAAFGVLRRRGCTPSSALDFVQQRVREDVLNP